ncbi:hypothetical protein [Nocardia tenerifensis]|nr:hypothetical protein [Nocardia tenerifensis]
MMLVAGGDSLGGVREDERKKIGDVLAGFAKTGWVGGLHTGMRGAELLETMIGLGLPMDGGEDAHGGLLTREESVEVYVTDDILWMLGLDHEGALPEHEFRLPESMGVPGGAGFTMDEMLALLAEHQCAWEPYPSLTFDDQTSIKTEGGVVVSFEPFEPSAEYVLTAMYASLPEWRG